MECGDLNERKINMTSSQKFLYQEETIHRTHDKFYLTENRKDNPKEYFKFIANIAAPFLSKDAVSAIDIGCATGDFVYFLRSEFPNISLSGMDVDEELLARASKEVEGVEFIHGDITQGELNKKFDVIFLNGVHSIFDDFVWLENLLDLMSSDDARVFVFGLFNPEDLDVLIKSRPAATDGKWETGWNLYSKKSVLTFLNDRGYDGNYYDFEIGLDLEKKEDDPLRSWTEELANGKRIIVNGLQLVNTLSLIEISKRK